MKGNKGKEIIGEEDRPEAQSQARLLARDKRKSLSKNIDLGSLPSRRDKRVKRGSSHVVKPKLPQSQLPVCIVDVDLSTPVETTLSKTSPPKTTAPVSSQPPPRVSTNIIENEDLAWERFGEVVKDEDINVCYDMSLKDFKHSGVHDLFKVRNCTFASSLSLHNFFLVYLAFFCVHLFIGHVKIHRSVQASH